VVVRVEWVFNPTNIEPQKIDWPREPDPVSDFQESGYFRDRTVWVAEADAMPVGLSQRFEQSVGVLKTTF